MALSAALSEDWPTLSCGTNIHAVRQQIQDDQHADTDEILLSGNGSEGGGDSDEGKSTYKNHPYIKSSSGVK